ncbi:MAG: flagellar assembly protein FliW [Selenomonadaceae bacterium]|nr:flagellar assembly protein FliW [Selenomonadaceae bacterium]
MRKIYTSRFGEIEVDEAKIVHFKDGIPAFEDEHEFIILPYEEESPYYFMQSLRSPDLAFLLTIPFLFFNDYSFEIDDETIKELDIKNQDDVFYYSMITIPNGSVRYMTANLLAPIVINGENMKAKQVVLEKSNYTTKHRLFPESAKKEG